MLLLFSIFLFGFGVLLLALSAALLALKIILSIIMVVLRVLLWLPEEKAEPDTPAQVNGQVEGALTFTLIRCRH